MSKEFDYKFPVGLIANKPAHPRDWARLMVFNRSTRKVTDSKFRELGKFLPAKTLLVLNDTKVLPARLTVQKNTGGRIQLLYLEKKNGRLIFLANKRLRIGEELRLTPKHGFRVKELIQENQWVLTPSFSTPKIGEILDKYGRAPLPPYIKNSPLRANQALQEYQTVFAHKSGSVAAPTASLHFTKRLLRKFKGNKVKIVRVTLHVGLGTFAPLTRENLQLGKLHEEKWTISKKAAADINQAKKNGYQIIAVGTTVVRTLESATDQQGRIMKNDGATTLFIRPGYKFKIVDGLVTNFHVPGSSLLMLVSAMAGKQNIKKLYQRAILKKYRLFSFGDAMLIL